MSGVRPRPIAKSVAIPPGQTFVAPDAVLPELVVQGGGEADLRELRGV